jgi:hypothetical protein
MSLLAQSGADLMRCHVRTWPISVTKADDSGDRFLGRTCRDSQIVQGASGQAAAFKAGYMAAPERFADRQISSCTMGAVHTWPEAEVAACSLLPADFPRGLQLAQLVCVPSWVCTIQLRRIWMRYDHDC